MIRIIVENQDEGVSWRQKGLRYSVRIFRQEIEAVLIGQDERKRRLAGLSQFIKPQGEGSTRAQPGIRDEFQAKGEGWDRATSTKTLSQGHGSV